jgi:hypothetical protein
MSVNSFVSIHFAAQAFAFLVPLLPGISCAFFVFRFSYTQNEAYRQICCQQLDKSLAFFANFGAPFSTDTVSRFRCLFINSTT